MTNRLPPALVLRVKDGIVQAGLEAERNALFAFVDPDFFAGLPIQGTRAAQTITDLNRLNRTDRLADGTVPLETYLRNAQSLTADPQANTIFQEALDAMDQRAAGAADWVAPDDLREYEEAIVHKDDKLPLAFLAGASTAAQSVAKLLIPRFENGAPAMRGAQPRRYHGTGWLIGPDLLITNHHVLRARDREEAAPAEADFEQQALGTVATFGFDGENEAGTAVAVAALLADNSALDYAIVRLAGAPGPPALRLAEVAVARVEGEYPAVNIIQHPGGKPKQIAIRNNLVTESTQTSLRYYTDTEQGSSGAPVFDDQWQVVGLHRAAGKAKKVTSFQGRPTAVVNVGTPIVAIAQDLRQNHTGLWQAIAQ